jgi:hypothetical protein
MSNRKDQQKCARKASREQRDKDRLALSITSLERDR